MSEISEPPDLASILVPILFIGFASGTVGGVAAASFVGLTANPHKMGAAYESIGFAVFGAFVAGGLFCGFFGLVSAAFFLIPRKSRKD